MLLLVLPNDSKVESWRRALRTWHTAEDQDLIGHALAGIVERSQGLVFDTSALMLAYRKEPGSERTI
jgi:hypothetical protein